MSCGREAAFLESRRINTSRLPLVWLNVGRRGGKEQKMTIKVDPIAPLPYARKNNGRDGPRQDDCPRANNGCGLGVDRAD